jgi:cytidine deaminase
MTDLLQAACEARKLAYAPYSRFSVGAAVLTDSGRIYSGCNIENASYGLTVCAERIAIFQAIAAGEKRLTALAVVADTPGPAAPCGACRQVMAEFTIETVTMANISGESCTVKFNELLPYAFSSNDMGVEPHEI